MRITNFKRRGTDFLFSISLFLFSFSCVHISAQGQLNEEESNISFMKFDHEDLLLDIPSISGDIQFIDHNGQSCNYEIKTNALISGQMSANFPNHRSFNVLSMDGKIQPGKVIVSPNGVYAIYKDKKGLVLISPSERQGVYKIEKSWEADSGLTNHLQCTLHDHNVVSQDALSTEVLVTNGEFQREFDMAIAVTAEYYQANGNNDTDVLSWVMMNVEGLNLIFENELSSTFILDDRILLYDDIDNDDFVSNGDPDSDNRIALAMEVISANFDFDEYDIGHVLHSSSLNNDFGGGGIAGLRALCSTQNNNDMARKAAGWSGSFNNQSTGFIGLFAHEIGHMFGASHTFNGTGRSCTNAISFFNAYEIGSGSTIMSYQGICDSEYNIPNTVDNFDYFHVASLYQMIEHLNNVDCHDVGNQINNVPEVDVFPCGPGDFSIPINTPFVLTGAGSDLDDDDELTYSWEQYDEDGALDTLTKGFIGEEAANSPIAPIFRSYPPGPSPVRQIPSFESLANAPNPFEVLPLVPREINMRFTVRDNRLDAGAVAIEELKIDVLDVGPLEVTSPNAGDELEAGTGTVVEWETNGAEVLCDLVEVYLSSDGGRTFDIQLAQNIPFDIGQVVLLVPPGLKNIEGAIIRVSCSDNDCYYFFNDSEPFDIVSECEGDVTGFCGDEIIVEGARGTDDLILDVPSFFADPIGELNIVVTENSDRRNVARFNLNGDCEVPLFSRTETTQFYVSENGTYTFEPEVYPGFLIMNIHDFATYDVNDLCASHLGTNARESSNNPGTTSTAISGSFTVDLEVCTEYIFTTTIFSTDIEFNLVEDGPGDLIQLKTPSADLNLTYVALNPFTNQVIASDPNGDFRALPTGTYDVRTVQYADDVDPLDWEGLNLFRIFTDCISVGQNDLTLIVTPGEDIELCDNFEDDDGDGLVDCDDPDLADDCCCLDPESIGIDGEFMFCEGDSTVLTVVGNFNIFVWSNGETTQSITVTQPDFYIVTAEDSCGYVNQTGIQVSFIEGDFSEVIEVRYCEGESVDVNNETFEEEGTYVQTLLSSIGCDSTLTINVFENPSYAITLDEQLCTGDTLELNGEIYTEGGMFTQTLSTSQGCDSLLTINIEVTPLIENEIIELLCAGESIEINGEVYMDPGVYEQMILSTEGCDTLLTIFIEESPTVIDSLQFEICNGESVTVNGETYMATGTFQQTVPATIGCDTLLFIDIIGAPAVEDSFEAQLCEGGTTEINGEIYDAPGSYQQTIISPDACDTILNITLIEVPAIQETFEGEICPEGMIEVNGVVYDDTGTYEQLLPATIGCDTVLTITITEAIIAQGGIDVLLCPGDTVEINGEFFTEEGSYDQILTGSNGCDSLLNIAIAEIPLINASLDEQICPGETVTINNETYDDGGVYEQILVNEDGCDTLLTITIESLEPSADSLSFVLCEEETAEVNGEIYSDAGDYEQLLTAANGCDSILTIFIEESENIITETMEQLCEGDTLFTKDNVIVTEGEFEDLYLNATGCDSIVVFIVSFAESFQEILDLKINSGDSIVVNGETFTSYGQYTQVLTTAAGCDSTITINVCENQNAIHYDMEDCNANITGANAVYSEFTADYPDALACGSMDAGFIFRNNANVNRHSCTPGVDGSIAVCVSSLDDCEIDFSSDQKLIFNIDLETDENAIVQFDQLSFYQRAPVDFDWIDGDSGPNNYPTLFGIRILKDGQEVYMEDGIPADIDWTEYSWDLSTDPEFEVTGAVTFTVEMMGYCLVGNGSPVSAWDIDELKISTNCRPVSASNRMIAGNLKTIDGQNLEGVKMSVSGDQFHKDIMSSSLGNYAFPSVPMYQSYELKAYNDENHLNGVSTLDIILIQRHIIGMRQLENPLLMTAADVNNDGSVSSIDLIELRKLILGIYPKLPQNTSWRFVVEDQNMNYQNFMNLEEAMHFYDLDSHHYDMNFKGIKTGDVNLSASANNLIEEGSIESRSSKQLRFYIDDKGINEVDKGIAIEVRASESIDLAGFQMTLELKDSELLDIEAAGLNLNVSQYRFDKEEGKIYMSWNQQHALSVNKDDLLFTILVDASSINSDDLTLSRAAFLNNEAYDAAFQKMDIELEWRSEDLAAQIEQKISIYPNPVKDVLFIAAENEFNNGQFEIISINGKLIQKSEWNGTTKELNISNLNEGMYYLRVIEAGQQTHISTFIKVGNN